MTRSETPPAATVTGGVSGTGGVSSTDGVSGIGIDRIERQFALLFDSYRQRRREQSSVIDPALQPSGYRVLQELVTAGPVGAGTLAEALGFDKSVLSRQLHQLEALGLVIREQDPADRRAVIISVTADAVRRVQALKSTERDEFRAILRQWPQHDVDELTRLLSNLLPD